MALHISKLNVCGMNVKRIRESKTPPMTQEQLAAALQMVGWDIDRFGISKIERGERKVIDKEILLFANVLDTPIIEFFRD